MSDHDTTTPKPDEPPRLVGMLAEFDGPDELVAGARAIREKGYRKVEAFSPYPIHGIDEALAAPKPILPWVVLGAGLTGCAVAILMQWYMNATEAAIPFSGYKFNISGKPFWSLPANIPVTFELVILFSAFTAFFGMIAFNKLPKFSNPLFHNDRFRKVTDDGFFLLVEAEDPQFAEESVATALTSIGSKHVEPLNDLPEAPIPQPFFAVGGVLAVVALVPLAYIAFARGGHSETPRISIWWDMDYQPKAQAQQTSPLFEDGRAMRLPVEGTVPRGGLQLDTRLHHGYEPEGEETFETLLQEEGDTGEEASEGAGEEAPKKPEPPWITEFPKEIEVSETTMKRGRQRFEIHCAVCHGRAGDGDGLVAQRAQQLQDSGLSLPTWKPPTSLHAETVRDQAVGKLYDTITNGNLVEGGIRGGMAGYREHISLEDRWAIVLYVKALQQTRNSKLEDLTEEEKASLQ